MLLRQIDALIKPEREPIIQARNRTYIIGLHWHDQQPLYIQQQQQHQHQTLNGVPYCIPHRSDGNDRTHCKMIGVIRNDNDVIIIHCSLFKGHQTLDLIAIVTVVSHVTE